MSPVMLETNPIVDIRATVVQNRRISSAVSIITLDCPAIAAAAKPGNFVNVKVSDATLPLLRRPFSIHNVMEHCIDIMVKSIGSRHLAVLRHRKKLDRDGAWAAGKLFRHIKP